MWVGLELDGTVPVEDLEEARPGLPSRRTSAACVAAQIASRDSSEVMSLRWNLTRGIVRLPSLVGTWGGGAVVQEAQGCRVVRTVAPAARDSSIASASMWSWHPSARG